MMSEIVESLYDESQRRGNIGYCPRCEDDAFGDDEDELGCELDYPKVLCYVCGVCFKYHHDDNFCDPINDYPEVP